MSNGFVYRIRGVDQIKIFMADHSGGRHLFDEYEKFAPVFLPHDYDWEILNLACLDERQRFEKFVERPGPAGHHHESIGIFNKQSFADEEVVENHSPVHICVQLLLLRKTNTTSDRPAAHFARSAIRRLHDSGTSTRHYREAEPSDRCSNFSRDVIMIGVLSHPR